MSKTVEAVKYHKVHQDLLHSIRSGAYAAHKRLPSEKALATDFGVSVGTVVRALETLVQDGILTRRRGAGTFVNAPESRLTNVVFVLPHVTEISGNSYLGPIFDGLCSACFEQGVSLEIANTPAGEWLGLPERFPDSAFYFVSPGNGSRATLTELWGRKPCFVVVGASWEEPVPFPTVDTDNRGASRRVVEYLLHQGHRRILFINGEDDSANCRDRLRGYEDGLRGWDIPVNPDWVIPAGGSMALQPEARNRLIDLLLSRQGPTAVFCAGYFLALEFMDAARRFGVAIPARISLVAVDDPKSAQYLQPPLTTLRQPLLEIGRRGASRLIHLMREEAPALPLAEHLPAEMVLRESCAPLTDEPFHTATVDRSHSSEPHRKEGSP